MTESSSPGAQPTDEQLTKAAKDGFGTYWTEDCNEDAAWLASARAVLALRPQEAQPAEASVRHTLMTQIWWLIDLAEQYARHMGKRGDADERDRIQGAIDHARKVVEPFNYNGPDRAALAEPSPDPDPKQSGLVDAIVAAIEPFLLIGLDEHDTEKLCDAIYGTLVVDSMAERRPEPSPVAQPVPASPTAGWQPIETAPKNVVFRDEGHSYGPKILVFGSEVLRARWWFHSDGSSNFIQDGGRACYPTRWMPLPPPPAGQAPSAERDQQS